MTTLNENMDQPKKAIGCGLIFLTIIGFIWVILFSGLDLFINWVSEQTIMEIGGHAPDFRWITHLITSLLILVVCLLMAGLVKEPRIRKIFKLWSYAAILSIITTPAKTLWLAEQNMTAILQISALLLMIIGSHLIEKKKFYSDIKSQGKSVFPGVIIFIGAILCLPWILWGALGSWLDTLLGIIVGIVFAWYAAKFIFEEYLIQAQTANHGGRFSKSIFDGLVVSIFLLISVCALAVNGSQQMLVVTIPIAGWFVTALSFIWMKNTDHGRLPASIILGLLFSLPLIFFDMDELTMIFTGGTGETLEWAGKAAWFTFSVVLFFSVILIPNLKNSQKLSLPKNAHLSFLILGLASIIILYFGWGQVGFFGDNQFVILKQQADLANTSEIQDYEFRRTAVYDELVRTAESTQSELRTRLDTLHLKYTPYYLVNGIEVQGGLIAKLLLQNDPSIDRILESPQLRPLPKVLPSEEGDILTLPEGTLWNLSLIHADQVNDELGISGEGILIGQTDSGVDGRHPEIAAAYRGESSNDDYNWYDPWNQSSFPTDISGHGTQTLGIILGQNTGVAPGAEWIGCVNLARNQGNPAYYLDCMQFMLAPFPQGGDAFKDGDASKGAMIVNNSWGCPAAEGCDSNIFLPAVDALKQAGIFMSVAAGNTGNYGCDTVIDPLAIYSNVLSSGSVNQEGNISVFSSLESYAVDNIKHPKPEILAPGENVISAFPGGNYSMASGTSFAAPHISGVVALMWSANPKLIGNVDQTTQILLNTSHAYIGELPNCVSPSEQIESGLVDAYQAVQAAIAWQP